MHGPEDLVAFARCLVVRYNPRSSGNADRKMDQALFWPSYESLAEAVAVRV
jgi:hypothetical protein